MASPSQPQMTLEEAKKTLLTLELPPELRAAVDSPPAAAPQAAGAQGPIRTAARPSPIRTSSCCSRPLSGGLSSRPS